MGRDINITQETVNDAAAKLLSNGQKVTTQHLRDVIGSGSNSTILPFFQTWKSSQSDKAEVREPLIAPTISRAIQLYLTERVQEALRAAMEENEEMRVDIRDLIIEATGLRSELEQMCRQNAAIREKLMPLTGTINQLKNENQDLKGELAAERKAREETRLALERSAIRLEEIASLHRELASLRAAEKAAREHAAELRGRLSAFERRDDRETSDLS